LPARVLYERLDQFIEEPWARYQVDATRDRHLEELSWRRVAAEEKRRHDDVGVEQQPHRS